MAGIENPLTHPTDDGTGFKLPEPVDQLVLLRTRNHELNDEINRLRHLESYKVWERKISVVDARRLEYVCNYLPAIPWSIFWHFKCRGAEYTLFYIWLLRDYGWFSGSYEIGTTLGAIAVAWSGLLILQAIRNHSIRECIFSLSRFLWLVGTFLWSSGALHDGKFPTSTREIPYQQYNCGRILTVALLLEFVNNFILRKLRPPSKPPVSPESDPFPDNLKGLTPYDEPRLKFVTWQFKCLSIFEFDIWRDYENLQLMFWIGRDLFAAYRYPSFWLLSTLMGFILNLYMVNTALNTRRVLIDYSHYFSMSIWWVGVFIYQLGIVYFVGDNAYNHVEYLYPRRLNSLQMCVYYGTWVTVWSFLPLVLLYFVWLAATARGLIKDDYELLAFVEPYEEVLIADRTPGLADKMIHTVTKRASTSKAQAAAAADAQQPIATASGGAAAKSTKRPAVRAAQPLIAVDEEDEELGPVQPIDLELSWIDVERAELFSPQ